MTLPPPAGPPVGVTPPVAHVPAPSAPRANGTATAGLVIAVIANLAALLLGVFSTGLDLVFLGVLAVAGGGVAGILGIVGIVISTHRAGRGLLAGILAVVLGSLPVVGVFLGRFLGDTFFGIHHLG